MTKLIIAFLVSTVIFSSAGESSSMMINVGFETGNLNGWQTIGDVSVQTGNIGTGPTQGSYQAVLTNDWDAYYYGAGLYYGQKCFVYPYSGSPAVSPSIINDAFFGLPGNTLDTITVGPHHVEEDANHGSGSAMKQSFQANSGDVLKFDWNYLTNDGLNYDFAFISVVSSNFIYLQKLAGNITLDQMPPGLESSLAWSNTLFSRETGFDTFSLVLPESDNYTVGIGVFQVRDTLADSAVVVDNFNIAPVPEPRSILFLGIGLLGLAWGRKKLKK
jgi:hypothetical protein